MFVRKAKKRRRKETYRNIFAENVLKCRTAGNIVPTGNTAVKKNKTDLQKSDCAKKRIPLSTVGIR